MSAKRRACAPVAATLAFVAVVTTAWLCVPTWRVAWLVAVGLVWVAPGVIAMARAYREYRSKWAMAFLLGGPFGFALSSVCLLPFWLLGVRSGFLLIAVPVAAGGLAWLTPSLGRGLDVPRYGRRDLLALALLVLIVPLVVARPYSQVGKDLPEGRAYRAYFTADFVWAMAVVSEVSKGDGGLPANPFHVDMPLHYYWLAHMLPSLEYRTVEREVRLDHLLLADAVLSAAMFLGFLYGLGKQVARSAAATAIGCVLAVLCTSPEGAYALWDLWAQDRPLSLVRYLNIDAISRWMFGALPIDGLQRLLLYQPQHQIGYALACTALLVMVQQARHPRIKAAGFAGVLLGCGLLISTFSAFMGAAMVGIVSVFGVVRARAWKTGLAQGVVAVPPLLAAIWLSHQLSYVAINEQALVSIGANPLAARHPLLGPVVSLGPWLLILFAAVWFAWGRAPRRRLEWGLLPGAAVVVTAFFYYFIDVRDHQDVYVGWRAGHFLLITTAGVIGWTWWRVAHTSRRAWRVAGLAALACYVAVTGPTVLIDLYNAQDLSNRQMAAGFPWTLVLGHDEVSALRWIATETPLDARVQVEPLARDPGTWAYVPAFGERRMAAGLPISMIPLAPYESLSWRVRRMYESADPARVVSEAKALHIDVLVVGQEENTRHPAFRVLLDQNPQLFPALFRTRNISLYAASGRMRAWMDERRH